MSTLDNLVRVCDALARPINERGDGVWRVDTAREALEILAERGVIPNDALDDPRRSFVRAAQCPVCGGAGRVAAANNARLLCACDEVAWPRYARGSYPETIADVVTLAARWPSVLAAEELTRVVALRLAPWGTAPVDRIVWRVGERDTGMPVGWHHDANDHAGTYNDEAWDERWQALKDAGEPYAWWRGHADLWAERDARQGECPHAPYLAILRLGFSIERIGDGEATMICPPMVYE